MSPKHEPPFYRKGSPADGPNLLSAKIKDQLQYYTFCFWLNNIFFNWILIFFKVKDITNIIYETKFLNIFLEF